jgi:hypothetical protein
MESRHTCHSLAVRYLHQNVYMTTMHSVISRRNEKPTSYEEEKGASARIWTGSLLAGIKARNAPLDTRQTKQSADTSV